MGRLPDMEIAWINPLYIYKIAPNLLCSTTPFPHQQNSPQQILDNKCVHVITQYKLHFCCSNQSLLLYHLFNIMLYIHICHAKFQYNRCSLFTECCFQYWKRFRWSKSHFVRFPLSELKKHRIKISHFSLELILSSKICILETRYNWSSDITKLVFIFRA